MRTIGIDYGTKRIGIALSDEGGRVAFPKEVIERTQEVATYIARLAEKENCSRVIVGASVDSGGRENVLMEDIRRLGKALEARGLRVFYEPEFFSSVEAGRFQGEGEMHDASAAAIILQRYLDKNHVTDK